MRTVELGASVEVALLAEPGQVCRDVGRVLACWSDGGVRVSPAPPMPEQAPPDATWRCDPGPPRRCTLLLRRPMQCTSGTCIQRHPRLPDDADWECAEVDGLVVCRDRAPPAGVLAGPPDPGWLCSEGRTPRICVDLAPDRPGAGNYACHFEHEPVVTRVCRPSERPTLGGPCRARCPEGMLCVEGVCVPRAIGSPDCWTSADCANGARCVLARCEAG